LWSVLLQLAKTKRFKSRCTTKSAELANARVSKNGSTLHINFKFSLNSSHSLSDRKQSDMMPAMNN
jgi:hypothetical protein